MKRLLGLAALALAALSARAENGCVVCHDVPAEQLGRSAHPMVSCADCHNGNEAAGEMSDAHGGNFVGRPDARGLAEMCAACHKEAAREWEGSPHAAAWKPGGAAGASCTDCHAAAGELSAHAILHSNREASPAARLNVPVACARCHGDARVMAPAGARADAFALYASSAHGRQVLEKKNSGAAVCSDCHSPHRSARASDPGSDTHPSRQAETCGECHAKEAAMSPFGRTTGPAVKFEGSPHARALASGAPSCAGCHGGHAAQSPPATAIRAACARCHAGPERALAAGPHHAAQVVDPALGTSDPLHCGHCHDVHGVPRPEGDFGAGTCAGCHAPGTPARSAGSEIGALSAATRADLFSLHALHSRARVRGHFPGESCEILTGVEARYRALADLGHGVDPEPCRRERAEFMTEAREVRTRLSPLAEPSRDSSWLGWVWGMLVVGVALFRLRAARREAA